MNKTKHVTFRCTEEQYALFKKAADKLELKLSAFILRSALFTQKQVNQEITKLSKAGIDGSKPMTDEQHNAEASISK